MIISSKGVILHSWGKSAFVKFLLYLPNVTRVQQGIQDFRIFDFCLSNAIVPSSATTFLKAMSVLFSLLLLKNVS